MLNLLLALAVTAIPQVKPAANTTCPACAGQVDDESPKVVLRGQEYRLCCVNCGDPLTKEPDNYLETDGTPRNAKNPRKPSPPVVKNYMD